MKGINIRFYALIHAANGKRQRTRPSSTVSDAHERATHNAILLRAASMRGKVACRLVRVVCPRVSSGVLRPMYTCALPPARPRRQPIFIALRSCAALTLFQLPRKSRLREISTPWGLDLHCPNCEMHYSVFTYLTVGRDKIYSDLLNTVRIGWAARHKWKSVKFYRVTEKNRSTRRIIFHYEMHLRDRSDHTCAFVQYIGNADKLSCYEFRYVINTLSRTDFIPAFIYFYTKIVEATSMHFHIKFLFFTCQLSYFRFEYIRAAQVQRKK